MSYINYKKVSGGALVYTDSITDLHRFIREKVPKKFRIWKRADSCWFVENYWLDKILNMKWELPMFFTTEELTKVDNEIKKIIFNDEKRLSTFLDEDGNELFAYKVVPEDLLYVRGDYLNRRYPDKFKIGRRYMFKQISPVRYVLIN